MALRENWLRVKDGRVVTPRSVVSRLDPGNYKLGTDTFTLAVATMAGREIGDEGTALAAEATLAEREQVEQRHGAERVADASGLANSYLNLGRFGRRSGLRDLVAFGPPRVWREGPVLEQAAYPDVLVAKAVSDEARPSTSCWPPGTARSGPESPSANCVRGRPTTLPGLASAS